MAVICAREQSLSVEDYVAVLRETSMRDRRPLANPARIARMLAGANFIVTARDDGMILGLARCITDGAWIAYCAELAVRENSQGRGIGKGILAKCSELLGPAIGFALLSEPGAVTFYEHAGMTRADGFFRARTDRS